MSSRLTWSALDWLGLVLGLGGRLGVGRARGQRGELQPGCPSVRTRDDLLHPGGGRLRDQLGDQLGRLAVGEAQLCEVHLAQLPAHTQAVDGQGRSAPARGDDVQPLREVLHEHGHGLRRGPLAVEHVEVVEHQHARTEVAALQLVEQPGDRVDLGAATVEPRGTTGGAAGRQSVQGGQHPEPQLGRVAICLVEGEPGVLQRGLRDPAAQQRGLPGAGRRGDQRERPADGLVEQGVQAWPDQEVLGVGRGAELRLQHRRERGCLRDPHRGNSDQLALVALDHGCSGRSCRADGIATPTPQARSHAARSAT